MIKQTRRLHSVTEIPFTQYLHATNTEKQCKYQELALEIGTVAAVQDSNSLVCHWGPVPTRRGGLAVRKGARLYCIYFCFPRWHHYLSIAQINSLRPSQSHSATESQSLRYRVKIFSRPAPAGVQQDFFTRARTHSRRP